jgi:hypothetical protein
MNAVGNGSLQCSTLSQLYIPFAIQKEGIKRFSTNMGPRANIEREKECRQSRLFSFLHGSSGLVYSSSSSFASPTSSLPVSVSSSSFTSLSPGSSASSVPLFCSTSTSSTVSSLSITTSKVTAPTSGQ